MPLFDYICESCSHKFEYYSRPSAPAPVQCPQCGAPSPKKELSSGIVIGSVGQKTMERAKSLGFKAFKKQGAGRYLEQR